MTSSSGRHSTTSADSSSSCCCLYLHTIASSHIVASGSDLTHFSFLLPRLTYLTRHQSLPPARTRCSTSKSNGTWAVWRRQSKSSRFISAMPLFCSSTITASWSRASSAATSPKTQDKRRDFRPRALFRTSAQAEACLSPASTYPLQRECPPHRAS